MDLKKITESFFDCVCDIYEFDKSTDPKTGVTSFSPVIKHSGVKCRISYATGLFGGSVKVDSSFFDNVSSKQFIKLFIPSDISVKPGCIFEVTKNNTKIRLKNSGRTYLYPSHQEILIENSEKYN